MAEQELVEKIYSRTTSVGNISMWGTLHVSRQTGKIKGWLTDSWSQGGPPYLHPKLYWLTKPDYKFHHVRLNIDYRSTIELGPEETDVEPERAAFIRTTLGQWEQDWLEDQSKKS